MQNEVKWNNEMDTALNLAQTEEKPILVDFFMPG